MTACSWNPIRWTRKPAKNDRPPDHVSHKGRVRQKTRFIPGFLYHLDMQAETSAAGNTKGFRAYDPRLEPIAVTVFAGERLSA